MRIKLLKTLQSEIVSAEFHPSDDFIDGVECLVEEFAPKVRGKKIVERIEIPDLKLYWERYVKFLKVLDKFDLINSRLFVSSNFVEASLKIEDDDFSSYVEDIQYFVKQYERLIGGKKKQLIEICKNGYSFTINEWASTKIELRKLLLLEMATEFDREYLEKGIECLVSEYAPILENGKIVDLDEITDLTEFMQKYTTHLEYLSQSLKIRKRDLLDDEVYKAIDFIARSSIPQPILVGILDEYQRLIKDNDP